MSFPNATCKLALMEKEASHCHISTDATYSLPREAIQKNHVRMITHMEKQSYLMYFLPEHLLLLLKQSLSFVKLLTQTYAATGTSSHQGSKRKAWWPSPQPANESAAPTRTTQTPVPAQPRYIWWNVPNALIACACVANTKQPFCIRTNSTRDKGQKHPVISGKTHLTKQLLLWRLSVDDLRRSTQCLLKISLRTKAHMPNTLDSIGLLGFWAILNSQLASSKHCHFLEAINCFSFS